MPIRRHQNNKAAPISYHVITRLGALDDIDRVYEYIARTHPLNAGRYVDRISDAIAQLETLPNAWPMVRIRKPRGVRQRIVGSHRILFVVLEPTATVHVLRVFDARSAISRAVRKAIVSDL